MNTLRSPSRRLVVAALIILVSIVGFVIGRADAQTTLGCADPSGEPVCVFAVLDITTGEPSGRIARRITIKSATSAKDAISRVNATCAPRDYCATVTQRFAWTDRLFAGPVKSFDPVWPGAGAGTAGGG